MKEPRISGAFLLSGALLSEALLSEALLSKALLPSVLALGAPPPEAAVSAGDAAP